MNEYDNWKLATPPEEVQCEDCGDYVTHYEVIARPGERYGKVLCPDCAEIYKEEIQNELNQIYSYENS